MYQREIMESSHKRPFHPFRVHLTTGATHDIWHPDLIMVGRRSAVIGVTEGDDQPVYDYAFTVDLLHIVGIEELPTPSPRSPDSANGEPAG